MHSCPSIESSFSKFFTIEYVAHNAANTTPTLRFCNCQVYFQAGMWKNALTYGLYNTTIIPWASNLAWKSNLCVHLLWQAKLRRTYSMLVRSCCIKTPECTQLMHWGQCVWGDKHGTERAALLQLSLHTRMLHQIPRSGLHMGWNWHWRPV